MNDCVHYKLGLCRINHKPCVKDCPLHKTNEERERYTMIPRSGPKYFQECPIELPPNHRNPVQCMVIHCLGHRKNCFRDACNSG